MHWRKPEVSLALGAAAQAIGVVMLLVGATIPVVQLAIGMQLADVAWLFFIIVSGIGIALLLLGTALGRRYQVGSGPLNQYQAAGEPADRTDEYMSDGASGDAGD
jgi:hypothetical protein